MSNNDGVIKTSKKTFSNKLNDILSTVLTVDWLINHALYILMIIAVIAIEIINYRFLQISNLITLVNYTGAKLILALGVAGTIVLAGTDLSAGKILAFTACISASLCQAGDYAHKMWTNLPPQPIIVGIIAAVLVGALFGFINGFFTAKYKLHPFISTLGTQLILTGLIMWYVQQGANNGMNISNVTASYQTFITAPLLKIGYDVVNMYVLYAVILAVIMWFIWNKTRFGKNMFACGANEEAARVSGVNVGVTVCLVFVLAGIYYGLAGFIEAARVPSNGPATGVNFELDAISACVIGGVSFVGGTGKISGVVIGVILLSLIFNGLNFLEVAPYWQYVIKGIIILVACSIDMRKYLAKK